MSESEPTKELFLAYRLERATRRMGLVGACLAALILMLGLFELGQKVIRTGWGNIGW